MPLDLKNARATYQRIVTKMFRLQIGKIVEVYIEDKVVKSENSKEHVPNLIKVFKILTHHRLWLNVA